MSRSIDREARKEQLAEAVWQIILDKGIGAVSVRTVADQAGLAVGSLRYIFPTRTELLRFSAELMVERATARVLATPWHDDPAEYALAVITRLLPRDPDTRAELEINLALVGECPAEPALVGIRNRAHEQLLAVFTRLVELLTHESLPNEVVVPLARRLHALTDGLALHLLHREPGDVDGALELIRDEIARIARTAP